MHRRHFCQALAGTAVATALGAQTANAATSADWTQAYAGLHADVEPLPLAVKGRLPAGLQGAFLRNGPARHGLGGMRYHHWFDGDGMLQRYTLSTAGIVHDGRFVRTAKFVADSSAGRPVRPAFGTAVPGGDEITAADDMNVANTSVVQHGGELMALWEGGSATVMDPRTLATRGPKVWSPDYAGVAFSAHPKIEPDGTMWNFGISSLSSQLSIYRVGADGRRKHSVDP